MIEATYLAQEPVTSGLAAGAASTGVRGPDPHIPWDLIGQVDPVSGCSFANPGEV